MTATRSRPLTVGLLSASLLAGVTVGAFAGLGRGTTVHVRAAALNEPSRALAVVPPHARNLAEAVERWNSEAHRWHAAGPGAPLTARATALLSGVGRARDTITAFPTSRGLVCFEIKAAGTCGSLDGAGITWAVLSTPGNSRIFGVASDGVTRVQLEIEGVLRDATLRDNAYFYQLAPELDDLAIEHIVVTWTDGSRHLVSMPGSTARQVRAEARRRR